MTDRYDEMARETVNQFWDISDGVPGRNTIMARIIAAALRRAVEEALNEAVAEIREIDYERQVIEIVGFPIRSGSLRNQYNMVRALGDTIRRAVEGEREANIETVKDICAFSEVSLAQEIEQAIRVRGGDEKCPS